jgi:TonB family protein
MELNMFRKVLLCTLLFLFSISCFSQSKLHNRKSSIVYLYVDKLPSFFTGNEGLTKYINRHLKWPKVDADVQGSVLLSFVITADGNIEYINVEKSLLKEFDDQAINLVQSMPKWNPGILKGEKVNVKLYLPIDFFLK